MTSTASSGSRLLRLAVGLGLMAALFVSSDPGRVLSTLAAADPRWLLLAAALVVVDRVVNAYRWLLLLRAIEPGRSVPLWAVMRVFFVSSFFGSFLPGSVGGDAVRTIALARLNVPAADAFASVMVDRILGVASILLMASAGLVVARDVLGAATLTLMAGTVGGGLALSLLLLFDSRVVGTVAGRVFPRRFAGLHTLVVKATTAIRQYSHHTRTLAAVLGLSVGVQVLRTLEAWALGRALGAETSLVWYFAFLPVIVLVMLLPVSIAGLGTGALAFQLLFGTVGMPPDQAFAIALVFAALAVIGNLPGGLLVALGRRRSVLD